MSAICVASTGVANLASVAAAFSRLGVSLRPVQDPAEISEAERVLLPGVGAFGPAMQRLQTAGLATPLAERVRAGRPTLAICLGLQLLFRRSAEAPGLQGLAVLDAEVGPFEDVPSPQLGWNQVRADQPGLVESGHAAYANSYRATRCPPGWVASWTDHGGAFVASVERGGVLACQFHPELSGPWGQALLQRWLEATC